ncbi:MAG: DUF4349 domain-containing protein [Chloroflexia bacterium]
MKRWYRLAIASAFFGLLVGCAPAAQPTPEPPPLEKAEAIYGEVVPAPAPSAHLVPQADSADYLRAARSEGRMIISTAQLTLIVDDVATTLEEVWRLVERFQGYTVEATSYRTATDNLAATVTIRVPSERFGEALAELRKLAWKVQRESTSGEDVTDQYVDLEARLKAQKATEEELLALLREVRQSEGNAQEKAEAILSIYQRLTEVRTQIEQIQGQMQYLEKMSAMATITLELLPREPEVEKPVVEEGFDPLRTLREAARVLVQILQGLVNALIWVAVVALPFWAVVGLLVFLWVRWRRRRAARKV